MLHIHSHTKFVCLVCAAGYYGSGYSCTLCSNNEIKTLQGDAPNCHSDTACDGTTNTPNALHTSCGKFQWILRPNRNLIIPTPPPLIIISWPIVVD